MAARFRSQGAEFAHGGVRYRTWSEHDRVEALILTPGGEIIRTVELAREEGDYFSGTDPEGKPGDLYRYRLGKTGDWPDPASRWQPRGVHGASMVIDPTAFRWSDSAWSRPSPRDLVIYELHIGTFTPQGTFRSALEKLDHLARLGVNAIELMPIADFPGARNWGYDGVSLYAPSRAYGTPDDLRALVDAAHALGLAVILDVVYNHLGPDGNYTGCYHRAYSDPALHTPWGAALNYASAPVRAFFVENAPYWMREFHFDGFRLDATHEIADRSHPHILAEITETVHGLGGFVIAEDDRSEPRLARPTARGGCGFDGIWADDFHHVVRVMVTGEREGYYSRYRGTSAELAQALTHGWLLRAQARGDDPAEMAPRQFIYCISNHDQVGNRAFGERLGHLISPAAYRAASALLCLAPQTPMLFMGQEWAASTPFLFFSDHDVKLGGAVTRGRRKEFRHFSAFRDPKLLDTIPDPQAERTFVDSGLRWEELREPAHAGVLQLYRESLQIRRTHPALRDRSRENYAIMELEDGIVAISFGSSGKSSCVLLVDLLGGHAMPDIRDARIAPDDARDWRPVLSSNETRFGGGDARDFREPTVLLLEAVAGSL